jgi:dipeptidyl aminopeptidase/acylaminoacyl peptidase
MVPLCLTLLIAPIVAAQGPQFQARVQSVQWTTGAETLAGGLLLPADTGRHPAIVLVHGAGPGLHDDPAFIVHANAFLGAGFAVLTYDKRGSGRSTGTLAFSDYDELASDVASAVGFLRRHTTIDSTRIGLLGRSEGGWVSAIAAANDASIAFVIISSGTMLPPREQTLDWTRRAMQAHGATDSEIASGLEAKSAQWEFYAGVANGSLRGEAARVQRGVIRGRLQLFDRFRPEIPEDVLDPENEDPRRFAAFTRMILYDPAPTFAALRVPILAVIGEQDVVVEPRTTLMAFDRLRARGADVTTRVFPGVGHSLLIMDGERIVGYPPGYLDLLTSWASSYFQR